MREIWRSRGIIGKGEEPPYSGESGTLLIVGSSVETWYDVEAFIKMTEDFDVMAINHTIITWPYLTGDFKKHPLKHAVCYDPGAVNHYRAIRFARHRGHDCIITHSSGGEADCVWELSNIRNMAFTACFASAISIAMGYDRIVLAGCSQSNNGHYSDPHFCPILNTEYRFTGSNGLTIWNISAAG